MQQSFTFYPTQKPPLPPPSSQSKRLIQSPFSNLQKIQPPSDNFDQDSKLQNPSLQYNKILKSITNLCNKLSKLLTVASDIVSSQDCAQRMNQIRPQQFFNLLATEIKPFISKFRNSLTKSKVFLERHSISPPKIEFLNFFSQKNHSEQVVESIELLVKGILALPDRIYTNVLSVIKIPKKDAINCIMKIVQYSYLSLNYVAQFLDLIIHSHYIYQQSTIKAICQQKIVQLCIIPIYSFSEKIRDIINEVEIWKDVDNVVKHKKQISNNLMIKFTQILYQIINCPSVSKVRDEAILIQDGSGVMMIISTLKKTFRELQIELYCYTIGMIAPLAQSQKGKKQLCYENHILKLLCNQLNKIYDGNSSKQEDTSNRQELKSPDKKKRPKHEDVNIKQQYLYITSPILMALRSLIHQNQSQKAKLLQYQSVIHNILKLSRETFQKNKKNRLQTVYYSTLIILSQLAYNSESGKALILDDLIPSICYEITGKEQMMDEFEQEDKQQNQQMTMNQQINLLWREEIKRQIEYAQIIGNALRDIKANHFNEQIIVRSFDQLQSVFSKNNMCKKYLITLHNFMQPFLKYIGSGNSNKVQESVVRAISSLVSKEKTCCDYFIRHKGIYHIGSCLNQPHNSTLTLRKYCFLTLASLLQNLPLIAQNEITQFDIFPTTLLQIIRHFPSSNVNLEVYKDALNTLTLALTQNPQNQLIFRQKNGLQALEKSYKDIVQKLRNPQKYSKQQVREYEAAYGTITVAINNAIFNNNQNQKIIGKLQIMQSAFGFLNEIIDKRGSNSRRIDNKKRNWDSMLLGLNTQDSVEMYTQEQKEQSTFAKKQQQQQQQSNYGEDSVIIYTLYLLINAIDTNVEMQQKLVEFDGIYNLVLTILTKQMDITLEGKVCLFLHNLVWNSKVTLYFIIIINIQKNQQIFGKMEIILQIVRIAGYLPKSNQNIPIPPDQSEAIYESILYALLATINMTQDNTNNQNLFQKYGMIKVLIDLLMDQTFEAKKTVCFCIGNLVRNNKENAKRIAQKGGVPLLANLINDNQDDQLSNRAFSALQVMGHIAAFEILDEILVLCQKIGKKSEICKVSNEMMINISMDSTIFKFLSILPGNKQSKILDKGFGNYQYSQQQSIQSIQKLEKYLPILNGIIYMNQDSKFELLKLFVYDPPYDKNAKKINAIDSLISIIQRVLPFAQAEYSLNILNNLVISSKQYVQDKLNLEFAISVLSQYLVSLASHQKILMQKSIKLFQIPPFDGGSEEENKKLIKYELQFVTEQMNEQSENQMTCYQIVNGKRVGEFRNPSMFLPDDIIDSLREQRSQIYMLLLQFCRDNKCNIQKLIAGGDKNQFVKVVGGDILMSGGDVDGQDNEADDDDNEGQTGSKKLFYKATEILLMIGEHFVENQISSSSKKGGGAAGIFGSLGVQNAKLWRDCLAKIESGPTTRSNAVIKARASQIAQQQLKKSPKKN